jgi:hypothetical protein
VKKYKMDRRAVKELMYGGIAELMRNSHYFYRSTVGAQYCHWTEEGQKALAEYMTIIGYKMIEAEEADLDRRSKDIVLRTLKGDVK